MLGSPFELAVYLGARCYKMIRVLHSGKVNADGNVVGRIHPTQKPVAVMREVIELTKGSVCDPFAGSGSTLVAAKQLRRHAIGVELEREYCSLSAARLRVTQPFVSEDIERKTTNGVRRLNFECLLGGIRR